MSYLFQWSLLAVSIASTALSTPLSTNPNFQSAPSPLTLAPLVAVDHTYGTINNSYIIILKDATPSGVIQNHMNFLQAAHSADPLVGDDFAGVQQVYDGHINGYAGRFTESVVNQIRTMPEVAYVEKDQIVRTQEVQKGAPWVSISLLIASHAPRSNFNLTFLK